MVDEAQVREDEYFFRNHDKKGNNIGLWYVTLGDLKPYIASVLAYITLNFVMWVSIKDKVLFSIDFWEASVFYAIIWIFGVYSYVKSCFNYHIFLYGLRVLVPLKRMPLYINNGDECIKRVSSWRLKIGR